MSVIAKILIVLNLLLAVVFLGAASTFLGQQESYKIKLEKLDSDKKREIDTLEATLKAAEDKATGQERLAATRQQEIVDLKGRFEAKETDYAEILKGHNTLLGQWEELSQTSKDLVAQNQQLTAEKDQLAAEKDQALAEKRDAIGNMNDANAEAQRLKEQVIASQDNEAELEKRLVAMADENDSMDTRLKAYENEVGPLPGGVSQKAMKAKVSGVQNELNIVLLSVGRNEGVQVGYTFTIYRGNKYVGQVKIDKVEKDYCSGYSVKGLEQAPISVGDDASTRL
jgi:chromosome segregation ATPase